MTILNSNISIRSVADNNIVFFNQELEKLGFFNFIIF